MPSGNITITPGRVLGDEVVTNDKLNDLGAPTARVDEAAITERELADGAFTGAKFADDAIGPEKLATGDLDDGDYLLRVTSGVAVFQPFSDAVQFPVGAPFIWPSNEAPAGCALMDGTVYDRATYPVCAALYSGLEGSEGDGVSTFALPDWRGGIFLRGRPVGEDVGDTGGAESATLVAANFAHSHTTGRLKANSGADAATVRTLVSSDSDYSDTGSGQQIESEQPGANDRAAINTEAGDWAITSGLKKLTATPIDIKPKYYNVNYAVRLG